MFQVTNMRKRLALMGVLQEWENNAGFWDGTYQGRA
jgi:hypothetical protein